MIFEYNYPYSEFPPNCSQRRVTKIANLVQNEEKAKKLDHSKILNRIPTVRIKVRHINEHKLDRHISGFC